MMRLLKNIVWIFFGKVIWSLIPKGSFKNWLRVLSFRLFEHFSFKTFVSHGEVVVIAGCWNILTVINWSECVGPTGKVIIIEANDLSYDVLKIELDRRSKLDNVTLVHKAAWNCKEQLVFEVADRPGSNKLKDCQTFYSTLIGRYLEEKTVDADTIDNILKEIGVDSVDHVHVTINGAEIEAIEGMQYTLSKNGTRIFILSETLHVQDKQPVTAKVVRMLQDRGYIVSFATHMPKSPDPIYGVKS